MSHAKLLKSVSRSFYLSMKFLPAAMREPVSLGYLLARASDTLADTAGVSVPERLEALANFRSAVCEAEDLKINLSSFEDTISHEGELAMLSNIHAILDWHRSLEPKNQQLVSEVLNTITEGQQWDLEGKPVGDAEALLLYTYRVAGCVGEFWTMVGFENLGGRFASPDDESAMLDSGRQLGQGLQLINILRDLHEDLPNGRCYLPEEELRTAGWDCESALTPEIVEPVFHKWLAQCREFLEGGRSYVAKVKNSRVRFSTKLPLLLAEATAEKLEEAGIARVMSEKVKISRSEVRTAAFKSLMNK